MLSKTPGSLPVGFLFLTLLDLGHDLRKVHHMNLQPRYPRIIQGSFILFLLLASGGCESGPSDSETGNSEEAFYPIDFCIVTGNDFDEEGSGMIPYTHVHDGITIKFCCKPCLPKFNKDPEKYLVILDEEMEALKKESVSDG